MILSSTPGDVNEAARDTWILGPRWLLAEASMSLQPVCNSSEETMMGRGEGGRNGMLLVHFYHSQMGPSSKEHKAHLGVGMSWSDKSMQGVGEGDGTGHLGLRFKEKCLACAVCAQVQPNTPLLNKILTVQMGWVGGGGQSEWEHRFGIQQSWHRSLF